MQRILENATRIGLHESMRRFEDFSSRCNSVAIEPQIDPVARIEHADLFFANTHAEIRHGGNQAYYANEDDYVQMPLPFVAERARRSAVWLAEDVLHRSVPLPGQLKLRTA